MTKTPAILSDNCDPLGVLSSTLRVVERAAWVRVDGKAVEIAAKSLVQAGEPSPDWDHGLHPRAESDDENATLVLVLDALNFCFWRQDGELARWQVTYRGETYNGYTALAAALRRAVDTGLPLTDPDYLRTITIDKTAEVLAGDPGCQPIPLLEARQANLYEVGTALAGHWDGSFINAIQRAGGSAVALVADVVETLPSFDDVAVYRGEKVRFYKRAQILIADLHGAFEGRGPGLFEDMHALTAFADYKVPQVLRGLGVLQYEPDLAASMRRQEIIPPGDEREIEIRAATIWAVELLRRALTEFGEPRDAYEIDWLLWHAGQSLPADTEPYHRTPTVFY